MKRTIVLPSGGFTLRTLQSIVHTVNRNPIWGEPAGSLFCMNWDADKRLDGTWMVTLHFTKEFTQAIGAHDTMLYPEADWLCIGNSVDSRNEATGAAS